MKTKKGGVGLPYRTKNGKQGTNSAKSKKRRK